MKRRVWIDIHNRDEYEEYLERTIENTRWEDSPLEALKDALRTYKSYKENERIIRRIEKKGVKRNGE